MFFSCQLLLDRYGYLLVLISCLQMHHSFYGAEVLRTIGANNMFV